jgi:hypothetical protein
MTFLTLPAPVGLDLCVTRQGNLPKFDTQSTLTIRAQTELGIIPLAGIKASF